VRRRENIQLLDTERQVLNIAAHRGFQEEFLHFFRDVTAQDDSTYGRTLRSGQRTVIEDVETDEAFAPMRSVARAAGYRSVQLTPLIGRGGAPLGMLSTHWASPHRPDEQDLRRLDLYARQAENFIERCRAEEVLREADQRKNEFIATLSHELRNPLAPLQNALELLRMGGKDREFATPIREMMGRQVNQLVRLVDDLLEISRINRGAFELRKERVDLAAVVRNALETSDPLITAARHKLSVSLPEKPLCINGDPVRLAQIVANLLNNAAKYTAPGGNIEVRAAEKDGMARVSVTDDGEGIAAELLPRLFQMFSRGRQDSGRGRRGSRDRTDDLAQARRNARRRAERYQRGPREGKRIRPALAPCREYRYSGDSH
jgi:signal transduction histidine kinase